jgi:cytochrome c5
VIKKILIATGVAAVVAVGGSMIHPFGAPGADASSQTILRQAQIDPGTLAILQRACQNCHSQQTAWPLV